MKPRRVVPSHIHRVPPPQQVRREEVTSNTCALGPLTEAIDTFEQELGGREVLRATLFLGESLSPALQRLLILLSSQQKVRSSLSTLCQKAGVAPGDFFAAFKGAMIARAQILMLHRVAHDGPAVMEAILLQARDREESCPFCKGDGSKSTSDGLVPCRACKGTGVRKVHGKLPQQKLVLELLGFLKKSGGLTILQNNQQGIAVTSPVPASIGGSLGALQQVIGDLMYGSTAKTLSKEAPAAPEEEPEAPQVLDAQP